MSVRRILDRCPMVLKACPAQVRDVALDRGSDERYDTITEGLESSLNSRYEAGAFGDTFSKQSTH